MAKPCLVETCDRTAVVKGKCRRCYNRTFYNPEKRRDYYIQNRAAKLEQKRGYYLKTRHTRIKQQCEYRARVYTPKPPPNTYGERVVPIAAKGWGYLNA